MSAAHAPTDQSEHHLPRKTRSQTQADYFERLKRSGYKKLTVWLPPEAVEVLKRMRAKGVSRSDAEAIATALEECERRELAEKSQEK